MRTLTVLAVLAIAAPTMAQTHCPDDGWAYQDPNGLCESMRSDMPFEQMQQPPQLYYAPARPNNPPAVLLPPRSSNAQERLWQLTECTNAGYGAACAKYY